MASRYWVGGTATWDGTAGSKWATTSGGAGGAAVPTAADDVFFDVNSTGTCTLSASSVARSLNCSGHTGTISHPASTTVNIGDSTAGASNVALLIGSGSTYTVGSPATSVLNFVSTSATQQSITSNGKTLPSLTFNGAGGSWSLADTLALSTGILRITAGSFTTNAQAVTAGGIVYSGSATRSLSLNGSTISLSINGAGGIQAKPSTNLTFSATGSNITINTSNTDTQFGTGLNYNIVNIIYGNGSGAINAPSCNFANLTVSGGLQARLIMASDINATDLTINSTGTHTLCVSDVPGTRRTFNVTNTPTIASVTFQDIAVAGPGTPYATTYTGDGGNNAGMTLSSPRTLYFVNNGTTSWGSISSWSLSSGGASGQNPPLCQDTAIFDANSITSSGRTISISWPSCPTLDFSNVLNNPAVNLQSTNGYTSLFGNFIMKAGMTGSGAGSFQLLGRNNDQILDTKGISLGQAINQGLGKIGGEVRLASDFATASSFTCGSGSNAPFIFNHNNFNVTCTSYNFSGSSTRTLKWGSGTITLTGTGTVLNGQTTTGLTLDPGTSTIAVTDTSSTSKTINTNGSGQTIGNVTITPGGTGAVIFAPLIAMNDLNCAGGPKTLQFNGNWTVNGNFNVYGTAGNLVSIVSNTPGSARTLTKASGITTACDYLSIQDSTATGGAVFTAGRNSTNVSNNTGWAFVAGFAQPITRNSTATPSLVKAIGKTLPVSAIAKFYRALELDGSTNYITVPHDGSNPIAELGGSYTVVTYFRGDSQGGNNMLWEKGQNFSAGVYLLFKADGQVQFYVVGSSSSINWSSATMYNDGLLHRAVLSFDSSANTYTLSIDGVTKVNAAPATGIGSPSNANPMAIGANRVSAGSYNSLLLSQLREFKVYNYKLTSTDITNLESGVQPSTGPIWSYDFGAGTGNTVFDIVGTRNGTIVGTANWIVGGGLYKMIAKTLNSTRTAVVTFQRMVTKTLLYNLIASPARVNYCPNPNFEAGVAPFTSNNGALVLSQSAAQALSGSNSARLVNSAAGQDYYISLNPTGLKLGRTYTLSAYYFLPSTPTGQAVNNNTMFLSDGLVNGAADHSQFTVVGAWTRISITATLSPLAVGGTPFIRLYAPQGTVYWDNILLEEGSSAGVYFDGSQTGFGWLGAVGNSISTGNLITQQIYYRALSAAGTAVATFQRRIGKTLAAAGTAAVTFQRRIAKTLAYAGSAVVTLARRQILFRSLSASGTATPSVNKMLRKTLSAAGSFIATLLRATRAPRATKATIIENTDDRNVTIL